MNRWHRNAHGNYRSGNTVITRPSTVSKRWVIWVNMRPVAELKSLRLAMAQVTGSNMRLKSSTGRVVNTPSLAT